MFSMMDAAADNNPSGRYVTGPISRRPEDLDLALEACLLEVDGEIVDSATGAAVHGHPAEALTFAANTLAERCDAIEAGWEVLTGGMTYAVRVSRVRGLPRTSRIWAPTSCITTCCPERGSRPSCAGARLRDQAIEPVAHHIAGGDERPDGFPRDAFVAMAAEGLFRIPFPPMSAAPA